MKNTIKIDTYIYQNEEFWNQLEFHCLKECCGIDAFNLGHENFHKTIKQFNKKDIIDSIYQIINVIENSNLKNVESSFFNLFEDKIVFKNRMEKMLNR